MQCVGEDASLDYFKSYFEEVRRHGHAAAPFYQAYEAFHELAKTKNMIDKIRAQMISRNFVPRVTGVTLKPPSIRDFEILKPISKGAYGRVFLAQKKTTRDVYAIKVLKREEMLTSRQRDNILLEVPLSLSLFIFSFTRTLSHSLTLSLSHSNMVIYFSPSLCRETSWGGSTTRSL